MQASKVEAGFESTPLSGHSWLSKLTLTDFRNYRLSTLKAASGPVVLAGSNGAGKTNCLEAISLLTAGRGLRSLPFSELARSGGAGGWAVHAHLNLGDDTIEIGTGVQPPAGGPLSSRTARTVKIDQAFAKGSGALARVRILWLTPAMDGLFTGPASERRRFLDRLALGFDPAYASAAATFDRAMRQRNKALETMGSAHLLSALEAQMASEAIAIAATRQLAVQALADEIIAERERTPESIFPWANLSLGGYLENQIGSASQSDLCASYADLLAQFRDRDRAAGRTLTGPHRSDIEVVHGPKAMPAKMCSTGEQKALLVGLILAQARLIKKAAAGISPMILLDEIAAHLDLDRRLALFSSITDLNAQVWMTGTDAGTFLPLKDIAETQFFLVSNGAFVPEGDAESSRKHYI